MPKARPYIIVSYVSSRKFVAEEGAGDAGGVGGDFLGGAGGHNSAAGIATFGPEVNDVVGAFDHVHIVLHHHQGVALLDEAVEG